MDPRAWRKNRSFVAIEVMLSAVTRAQDAGGWARVVSRREPARERQAQAAIAESDA